MRGGNTRIVARQRRMISSTGNSGSGFVIGMAVLSSGPAIERQPTAVHLRERKDCDGSSSKLVRFGLRGCAILESFNNGGTKVLGDWAYARKISMTRPQADASATTPSRRRELLTFFILAFAIWPIVAVAVVGGYGFLVWMYQIVFGPPGPPADIH